MSLWNRKLLLWLAPVALAAICASCELIVPGVGNPSMPADGADGIDHRAWQHGLDIVQFGGRRLMIWSSWGNPPHAAAAGREDAWQHDVYCSWLNGAGPRIAPRVLAGGPGAQEPASSAVNSAGSLLITCEDARDGEDSLQQTAGLWDARGNLIRDFPLVIDDEGHSGHVAAMQDKFLVAYCTGWVEGGGVDNLGTGDDVWAKIVTPAGEVGERIDVSVQDGMRDWWPLVAGSDRNWLVVWQRYEGDDRDPACTVHAAIVGPSGRVQARTEIMAHAKPYYYNVSYVPALGAYAVWGSQKTGGFLVLVDRQGQIVNAKRQLPPTVRESKLVSSPASKPGKAVVAYPVFGGGAAVLEMTRDSIAVVKQVRGEYRWDYIGTDGYFVNPDKAVFASLSRNGVQFVTVDGLAK